MKSAAHFLVCCCLFVLAMHEAAFAQRTKNQQAYVIDAVLVDHDIELTGHLSDPAWASAPTVECPFEIQPGENTPARQRTQVKVLYNARYLYLGFVCYDTDPTAIRAHVSDRDNSLQDDFVFVALDPYMNNQRAYEFIVNPYGVQTDLMRTGNSEDASWDAVWYTKGAIDSTGYKVEIAIPFKSIRFPSADVQDWALMLIRNVPRESRYQNSWTFIDRNDPCTICQAGTLRGLRGLQSTASLELLPYAMGFQSGSLHDTGDPLSGFANGKVQGRVGGGVKYVPDPSLAIEGVVNPDFSQVESDATQISVNTTFAINYPEKRPFFQDVADIFNTQIPCFYSRMINNPLGAAKIVQKSQHLTLAYLGAMDRNTPFIVPGEEGSSFVASSLRSFSNVLRAKYDFGKQSYIGLLGTTRNLTGAHNYAGGVDWSFLFGENYTFEGQALLSNTREVNDTTLFTDAAYFGGSRYTKSFDGESYNGTAFTTDFRRDARNYSFELGYRDYSPTFLAQDGFVTGTDTRVLSLENEYEFYPANSFVDKWLLFVDGGLHFNHEGVRKERWTIIGANVQMKSQTNITASYFLVNEERFHNVLFPRINRGEVSVSSAPSSALQMSADLQIGKFIHRTDNPSLGTGHQISASLTLKPISQLAIDLTYARARLSDASTHALFYDGYIARLSTVYQFTNDLFLRVIGQYDQFNTAIEVDPLLSYKLNPFTIFYMGSTHSFTDFGTPFGVRATARQFFMKLQYLWRD